MSINKFIKTVEEYLDWSDQASKALTTSFLFPDKLGGRYEKMWKIANANKQEKKSQILGMIDRMLELLLREGEQCALLKQLHDAIKENKFGPEVKSVWTTLSWDFVL